MSSNSASQVILAPSHERARGLYSIFLAGTTSRVDTGDWRGVLSASLANYPLTIYNPYRPDWDSTWHEDVSFLPFREQVQWELDKQDKADVVAVYFHPETQAPISLLEFGLSAPIPGKVVVVCPHGFWKRGNVELVCDRFGIDILDSIDELQMWIVNKFDWHRVAAS
jgi:hypothetical protein